MSGESLLTAWQNNRLISANGTNTVVFDGHDLLSDSDGDSIDDRLDLDSDNDGIPDNVEAQSTAGYLAPSGGGTAMTDADKDGLDDNYDANTTLTTTTASQGLTPGNTDTDSKPDYLDLDSDNDGDTDAIESGISATTNASFGDINGSVNNPISDLENTFGYGTEVNFREYGIDTDADGIVNAIDIDDDNDGIVDAIENIGSNHISNGNFESYSGDPKLSASGTLAMAADWTTSDLASGGQLMVYDPPNIVSNKPAASWPASTALTGGSAGHGWLGFHTGEDAQDFLALPLVAGKTYTLSLDAGYTVYPGIYTGHGKISFYGVAVGAANFSTANSLGTIPDIWNELSATNQVWQSYAFTFTAPQNIDRLYLVAGSGGGGLSYIYFDKMNLVAAGEANTDAGARYDYLDLDSDNDGISDLVESGASAAKIAADVNKDGTISLAEAAAANGGTADVDGDGLMDMFDSDTSTANKLSATTSVGTVPVNTDGDVLDDWRDLDSDGDGIPDTVEARLTAGYVANDGDVRNNDSDNDGVIDLFDSNDSSSGLFGGSFALPVDTDSDGIADNLDPDSDNDGISDRVESGLAIGASDEIQDGILDLRNASYMDPDGLVNPPATVLFDNNLSTPEVAYREFNDRDGDGISDSNDIDDDNDGILDSTEHLNWMQNSSAATLKLNQYTNSSMAATGTPSTYTTLSGGDSAGETVASLVASGRLISQDATYLYVLGDTNDAIEKYSVTNGSYLASYVPTWTTLGSESLTDILSSGRLVYMNATEIYKVNSAGHLQRYTYTATDSTWTNTYNTYSALSGAGQSAGETIADLAVQNRILGVDATYVYVLSDNSGRVESYNKTTGAYIATTTNTAFTAGDLAGETLLSAWANGKLISTNGTTLFTVDAHQSLADSDGDGIDDRLDLDSDNDGIPDNVEAQTTVGYIAPERRRHCHDRRRQGWLG